MNLRMPSRTGFVCERDFEDELRDFVRSVRRLKRVKRASLPLRKSWFDEDEDIPAWCAEADEKWEPRGMCLAAIDIDSDSYVLFVCGKTELALLESLAQRISCRIAPAKNM